jgi:DNA-binding transcriptional regulator GbsR (MarR family)
VTESPDLAALRTDFIERMGVISHGDKIPRIAGQIFAILVFEGEAITFGDLARELEVSRASVSTSVRFLEERGMIRRVNRRGERQDYFQLADNAYVSMLRFAQAGTLRSKAEIDVTLAKLPEGADGVRQRLDDFANFYRCISDALEQAIDQIAQPDATFTDKRR